MRLTSAIIYIYKTCQRFSSELMKLFLRLNGATIGKGTYISISAKIIGKKAYIGKDCKILENVRIFANEICIGDSVIISSGCMFTGKSKLSIGDKTYIGKRVRINLSREVEIGYDVGIGENSSIFTHGYFPPADEGYPVTYASVRIEDCVWMAAGIIILPGVTIGEKAIIAAGSVITKSVPKEVVAEGNPAKIIIDVKRIINKKDFVIVMEEIIDQYKSDFIVKKHKDEKQIVYFYNDFEIYIIDGLDLNVRDKNRKARIILFKNCEQPNIKKLRDYYWFDFNKKIQQRTNYKEFLDLSEFLRGFGIRFLVNE